MKSFVLELPSFIQDSIYVLNKITGIKNIGSARATMDVESHYTNIDHKEGSLSQAIL